MGLTTKNYNARSRSFWSGWSRSAAAARRILDLAGPPRRELVADRRGDFEPTYDAYDLWNSRADELRWCFEPWSIGGPREADVVVSPKLTIEHVMPQAWREHWKLGDVIDDGGIAIGRSRPTDPPARKPDLLTGEVNSALSNAAWPTKQGYLV